MSSSSALQGHFRGCASAGTVGCWLILSRLAGLPKSCSQFATAGSRSRSRAAGPAGVIQRRVDDIAALLGQLRAGQECRPAGSC